MTLGGTLATRRFLLTCALVALGTAGTALASCARSGTDWAGGPVDPGLVQVSLGPSLSPVDDAVRTGIVIHDQELILFLYGGGEPPWIGMVWRDTKTGELTYPHGGWSLPGPSIGDVPPLFDLSQVPLADGTIVELGAIRTPVARITSTPPGGGDPIEARFAKWHTDPSVTIFWLRRSGAPIPGLSSVPRTDTYEPWPPDRYPLITAYDSAGHVIVTARLRDEGYQLKGG
jgi:hypothetical protein